jgi:hypothetical protein
VSKFKIVNKIETQSKDWVKLKKFILQLNKNKIIKAKDISTFIKYESICGAFVTIYP